jgi:hypothetical protein
LIQLNAVAELHERIFSDLEQRGAKIEERENEARRMLEQILTQCAADRASIAQEKMVLSQAQELYVRFLGGGNPAASAIVLQPPAEASASASLEQIEVAELSSAGAPSMEEEPQVQTAQPGAPAMEPGIGRQIDELRRNVHESVLLELKEEEEKSAKWPGPFKGLLNRN